MHKVDYSSDRYYGCYNASAAATDSLTFTNGPLRAHANYEEFSALYPDGRFSRARCAEQCWKNGLGSGIKNPRYNFFAVTGGAATPGASKCLCGSKILTAPVDPKFCWGQIGSSDHKLCADNGGASCGGNGAAILFARTDYAGTCEMSLDGIMKSRG